MKYCIKTCIIMLVNSLVHYCLATNICLSSALFPIMLCSYSLANEYYWLLCTVKGKGKGKRANGMNHTCLKILTSVHMQLFSTNFAAMNALAKTCYNFSGIF